MMNLDMISDLEEKVGRAIELIAGLKDKNKKIEEENMSLKRRLEDLRAEFDGYRKDAEKRAADASGSRIDFDCEEVKKRLSRLAGRLAALEDSWI
ncbi:MAG: cell division protein ZapB [Candidatus Zixiibacteriota bacterium]|nr:MAG: cell division protein ZapB [candidate division Zixibacteria bacterium]